MPSKRLHFQCEVCRNIHETFEQATVCEAIHAQLQVAFEAIEQAIEYVCWLRSGTQHDEMYVYVDLHSDPPKIELRRRLKDQSDQLWAYRKGAREILSGSRVPSVEALIKMGWRQPRPARSEDDENREQEGTEHHAD